MSTGGTFNSFLTTQHFLTKLKSLFPCANLLVNVYSEEFFDHKSTVYISKCLFFHTVSTYKALLSCTVCVLSVLNLIVMKPDWLMILTLMENNCCHYIETVDYWTEIRLDYWNKRGVFHWSKIVFTELCRLFNLPPLNYTVLCTAMDI